MVIPCNITHSSKCSSRPVGVEDGNKRTPVAYGSAFLPVCKRNLSTKKISFISSKRCRLSFYALYPFSLWPYVERIFLAPFESLADVTAARF